jgi:hypothetical protein
MNEIEQKVDYLIRRWTEGNSFRSDINTNDLAYFVLIELGAPAIPYLLARLGDSWIIISALHQISGETIDYTDIAGKFNEINAAWRRWGQAKGLI